VPFRLTLINPCGISSKLDVEKVAFALVVAATVVLVTFTLPELIVTLVNVTLPTEETVPPRVSVVLPRVVVLLAKKEFGNMTATEVMLAFVYVPFVSVVELIVPPVITTALAF